MIATKCGPLKAGLADNPIRRLPALRTGYGKPLALLHVPAILANIALDVARRAYCLLREHLSDSQWFAADVRAAKDAVDSAVENSGAGKKAKSAVGRPPIKAGLKMVKQTVWLDPPLVARIVALVGDRGMSEFVRTSAEAELRKRERKAKVGET